MSPIFLLDQHLLTNFPFGASGAPSPPGANMSFKNILFPVDGSERAAAAAPFVSSLVRRYNATLTLASFVEIPAAWYGAAEVPIVPEMNIDRLVEETEHTLAFFAADHFAGLQPVIRVEQGDPGTSIRDLARSIGADLIAMPTRGRGRFRAALLGSVAAKVLHDAACPVWTAAHLETTEYAVSPDWRRIVCAIDTTPEAAKLIHQAAELAADSGGAVLLVHAIPASPAAAEERYFDRDFDVFLKSSARTAIEAMQKEAGTNFRICIGSGNISAVVAASALDYQADLVLAGRGTLPAFAGGLRTHLYGIIRDVACPVLSV
jgi:nucleotide-binding universal stress UspA family protein